MPKLVNLGSLCIDNVYQVRGISRAGETIASDDYRVFPGGKGLNQSLAAARAGASVTHFGCVGVDGQWLIDELAQAGIDVSGVRTDKGSTSGHAVIQVTPQGENAIVITGGANRTLTRHDLQQALNAVAPEDFLLLQNEINDVEVVLSMARERGIRTAFNLAPADGRERGYDLGGVDLLIVNEIEAAAVSGQNEPARALDAIHRRYPETDLVLTMGRDGLLYRGAEGDFRLDAFPVDAVDETAAGDAFIGYLMAALLCGEATHLALARASAAGALATTRAGAASSIPWRGQVAALLDA